MTAAFSRLQLAAALLEYDNDPSNPEVPFRSAHESAIFLPFRRNAARSIQARKSDYLGVAVPSEAETLGGRESALGTRKPRSSRGGSIDMLRNPFGGDNPDSEEEHEEEEMEVDLASWGLDQFMPKEKGSKDVKGKGRATALQNPHTVSTVLSHKPHTNNDSGAPRRVLGSRSLSVGNLDFHINASGSGNIQSSPTEENRRRSFASPLDLAGVIPSQELLGRRRALSNPLISPLQDESQMVPFPSKSVRSPSPTGFSGYPLRDDALQRVLSIGSQEPRTILQDDPSQPQLPPPEDNPFALRPPSRTSRFDPKAATGHRARTPSIASMGSRAMFEPDAMSIATGHPQRDPRYSTTLELMRPKVLVMPSPLQATPSEPPPPSITVQDGFSLTTDGPPLPHGARTGRRGSLTLGENLTPPIASNSFTPNATSNLTLSQKMFRNTLVVGGKQDGDAVLPRAIQDGEQARFDEDDPEPSPQLQQVDESGKGGRPPGKLYGKSLIDDLENRKAQMRSKQRVFTGDQRPSMMQRGTQRSSTLIDVTALQPKPVTKFGVPETQPTLARRGSANIKPLLNFDDEKSPSSPQVGARLPNSRSVFGVDTLWEREMSKLQEIEAKEKLEEEERRKREEEEELKRAKKGKKKKKKGGQGPAEALSVPVEPVEDRPRVSVDPPILPQIPKATGRQPPPVVDDDVESDASNDAPVAPRPEAENWHADSSEDELPRRTTGTGPRYPRKSGSSRRSKPRHADDSDDEDVPLSIAVQRGLRPSAADSDEEKPLSMILEKTKLSLPPMNFGGKSDDDDDNQPLGLRASRFNPLGGSKKASMDDDDDDRPLAYHPEQQRRTQYQMMAQAQAQAQAQQQQLMMQAQFANSMFFSPPAMMTPGFYGPPMMAAPMMMQPPMPIPSPPPMVDEVKFGRVDQWRRNVAVDSET